jgi:hypothetical protein
MCAGQVVVGRTWRCGAYVVDELALVPALQLLHQFGLLALRDTREGACRWSALGSGESSYFTAHNSLLETDNTDSHLPQVNKVQAAITTFR